MGGGPPCFTRDSSCPALLGLVDSSPASFAYRAFTSCGPAFQLVRLESGLVSAGISCRLSVPHPATPIQQLRQDFTLHGFGLFPFRSPLLRESLLFSFPPGTEMFQFPGYHRLGLVCWAEPAAVLPAAGCPIGVPPDLCLLAAPRSLSQLAAPFFASWHQGIHRTLLLS